MKPGTSGTAQRLFLAFAGLIALYGASSAFAIAGFSEIHDGLGGTRRLAEGVRLSLELASAVRDQYAHQAHTIILGNASHLGFYSRAEQRVRELTKEVRQHAQSAEEQAWVDDIEKASLFLDQIFRGHIVPAVLAGDRAEMLEQHSLAQEQVSLIQERTDALARRFEESIGRVQTQVSEVERRAFRFMLLFLLGAPVLAVLVWLWVSRSVAGPVARLQAGAARLAGGDLDTRIEIDTPDEFGALARQFNAMTLALKENQARLVETEKLAGIGRLAAGVAHEINNPLGVILGYTRLLRKRADVSVTEDLQIIEAETLRCQEIVEGLLDLSRPFKLSPEPVDLRELCEEVVARLADSKQLEGVSVKIEGSAQAAGQPQRLRQVVFNLIKNAVEATAAADSPREVLVKVSASEGAARVAVEDTGPGLHGPDVMGRLFEPFFTTKPQGTGLGLAVSRAIARAHGGDLVPGASQLGGALFELRLPAAAPPGDG